MDEAYEYPIYKSYKYTPEEVAAGKYLVMKFTGYKVAECIKVAEHENGWEVGDTNESLISHDTERYWEDYNIDNTLYVIKIK